MKKRFDEHDSDAAETERRMKEYQEIGLSMFNLIYGKFEFRQKKGMSRPTLIHRYLKPGSQEERKGRVALAPAGLLDCRAQARSTECSE